MKPWRGAFVKNTASFKEHSVKINGLELNDHDLNQRYHNTFVRMRLVDREAIVLIDSFIKGSVNLTEGKDFLYWHANEVEILQDFPSMGAVNHAGNVHVLSRKPLRQWLRGLHPHLITDFCRNPQKSFENLLPFDAAKSCFNREYFPLSTGLELLKKDYNSFAINEHYWLSGKKKTYLWRDTTCLGELLGNRLFAFPAVCVMKDEINHELGGCYEIA